MVTLFILLVLLSQLANITSQHNNSRHRRLAERSDVERRAIALRGNCNQQLFYRGYCKSHSEIYDDDQVNKAIDNHMETLRLFNESRPTLTAKRLYSSYNPACRSNEEYVRPISIKRQDGSTVKVLNSKDFYQYDIVVECLSGESKCMNVEADGQYETVCRQLYSDKKFIVLHGVYNTPMTETFRMPSGCECHTKRITS